MKNLMLGLLEKNENDNKIFWANGMFLESKVW
jgi:hypothetical protein